MRRSNTPLPDTSDVGQVSRLHAGEGRPYLGRCAGIEIVEPTTERTAAPFVDIFPDLDHTNMVTPTLP